MKFYFTNQTCDRQYAREQELKIERETGLELENPFYDGEAKEIVDLDAGRTVSISADEIVGMDLRKIRDSRGIVALMSSSKDIGSCMEIAIGAHSWGKPVFVIAEYDGAYNHPWIQYFATKIFRNADQFIAFANSKMMKKVM